MDCFSETEDKVYRNVAAKTEEVPPKLQGTLSTLGQRSHLTEADQGLLYLFSLEL